LALGDALSLERNTMTERTVRGVLWLHTLVMGLAGLLFLLLPKESATLWPWALPALAARFVGALFLGGAACSLACLRQRDNHGLFVLVLLAAGDALIALSGLLGIDDIGFTAAMIGFLAFFAGVALLLVLTVLPVVQAAANRSGTPVAPALRAFFLIHLLVVLPVGTAMFFLPSWAQAMWPWKMTPINVRLIGSFFFGAALISAWTLRQPSAQSLRAVLVLYAVFATMATIASLIHFNLFNPARPVTWAFFALYVFVAVGSCLFLLHPREN
jgi:hypothetical protein